MATEALRRRALPRAGTIAAGAGAAVFLVSLLGVSAFARTRAIDGTFWIDEGLSVGIASFPLKDIPGVLRQDGSPPLYYLLLALWMDVFGSSEAATHALSLVFALAAVPVALWAAASLFGRRAGWIAAALAAVNPFLTVYAQETRMYSLVILLSVAATAAFLHAFVFRRRRHVVSFGAVLAVMLYTHNWALFFAVGALAALLVVLHASRERRAVLVDAAFAFGGASLAYVPWLPTLVYQAFHTGAPWSNPPSPFELVGGFSTVLAGQGSLVAVLLAGGVGAVRILEGPANAVRTAVLATTVLAVVTLASGWLFSQFTPAWANRYLGVLVGPVLLVAAAALPRAGRLGLVALALVLVFWTAFRADGDKSNADTIAALFADKVRPGDVILSTQPEQVPVLAYYFGPGHSWATPLGRFRDPRVMDWRNALERLEASTPETTLEPIVEELPSRGRIVLVRPLVRNEDAWSASWTRLVRRRSEQWANTLATDDRFTRTEQYVPPYTDPAQRALAVELFEKRAAG